MSDKVYISYVIQAKDSHSHHYEIITVPPAQQAVYADNTSQKVIEWVSTKQKDLSQDENIVILNYFSISNYN